MQSNTIWQEVCSSVVRNTYNALFFHSVSLIGTDCIIGYTVHMDIEILSIYGGPLIQSKCRVRNKCCVKPLTLHAIKRFGTKWTNLNLIVALLCLLPRREDQRKTKTTLQVLSSCYWRGRRGQTGKNHSCRITVLGDKRQSSSTKYVFVKISFIRPWYTKQGFIFLCEK